MKRSYLAAAIIILAVTLWMVSGLFGSAPEAPATSRSDAAPQLTHVEVARFEAQPMQREVVIQGQTQAKHTVTLKTEIAGQVLELLVEKGDAVKRGDILLRLSPDERPHQLEQARALQQQRELEYQAAKALKSKGLQAERQLAEAVSLLRAARVQLKSAELNVERQTLRAPFDGVIQARQAEQGDYLKVGDPVLTLVNLNPLVVRGDVAESEVDRLQTGMAATAQLSNGALIEGRVSFIAPVANSSTRTYAVEMEAENPLPHQRGGMSATIRVPLEAMSAYKVSPALLSLNDNGVLGLKSVDAEGVVQFHPVEVLKSERDGLWLGGLPPSVDLITVGQGFVRAGDRVAAARDKAAR